MHSAVDELTPADALDLVGSPWLYATWRQKHGLAHSGHLLQLLWERAEACLDEPSQSDARRRDADSLRQFSRRAARLPARQRQIASLLLDHGLSLTECARELGISRETARTHLRRLRESERRARARMPQTDAEDPGGSGDADKALR